MAGFVCQRELFSSANPCEILSFPQLKYEKMDLSLELWEHQAINNSARLDKQDAATAFTAALYVSSSYFLHHDKIQSYQFRHS